ncbi:MAG: hypothetical protein Q4C48_00695 [Lachnospiraceae bacterium]|nr:hypothetical protein [Lachnospiraceae bacterium]
MSKPSVCRRLAHAYHELAWMNLTIGLYDCYERYAEASLTEPEKKLLEDVFSAVRDGLTEAPLEETQKIERLSALRGATTENVEALAALVDRLMIPEYLLNRAEYSFRDELPERDTENEARELLQHIFSSEDPVVVNQRIRDMVFQLPVRMTKQRFFDLVQQGLSAYQDGELSALDGFCERIAAAAGLPGKRQIGQSHRAALAEELSALDYGALTKERWEDARQRLEAVEAELEAETDFGCNMQGILNDTLCIVLVAPHAEDSSAARKQFLPFVTRLLGLALQGVRTGEWKTVPEEEADCFSWMEGKLEQYSESVLKLESAFESLPEKERAPYRSLEKAGKLMSTSAFASLEDEPSEAVTPELLEARRQELFRLLEGAMEGKSRKYVRAMMASMLKELPVFFDSHTDVMNYVLASLGGCKDPAEKNAALDLLWELYGE